MQCRTKSTFQFLGVMLLFALNGLTSFAQSGGSALVLIDMQPGFATRSGFDKTPDNQNKLKQLIQVQLKAIESAKKNKLPIIFIEYSGSFGETDSRLKGAAKGYKSAKTILKDTDGVFETSNSHRKELIDYLKRLHVTTLIIAGANGGACVQESIQGALDNNYSVVAVTKAIADFNYPEFIYPFVHHYDSVQATCQSCTFKETDELDKIIITKSKIVPPAMSTLEGKSCKTQSELATLSEACGALGKLPKDKK